MITLFELYNEFKAMVNTSQNGFWRPENDFEKNVNVASDLLFNKKTEIAERDQKIVDDLRPYLISKNIIVEKANSFYGIVPLPTEPKHPEYSKYASARMLLAGQSCVPCQEVDQGECINGEFKSDTELTEDYYNTVCEVQIEKIDNQRWPSVLQHLTKRPTLLRPKLTQINNQFQVAPRDVSVVVLNYYRKPKYATFKYTLTEPNLQDGSGDVIIYNEEQSQPLEWPSTVKTELLDILKDMYVGFTRDSQYQQINSAQKQTNP